MKEEIALQLIELNRRFYAEFGDAFAATRRRIQPGIRRVLDLLPDFAPACGDWLDLGCGAGQVGLAWAEADRQGSYLGMDFSAELLRNAAERAAELEEPGKGQLSIEYEQGDMSAGALAERFTAGRFDGVLAFASLHHLPGEARRLALLDQIGRVLKSGGWFIHSEWQFQNSPRLMARVLDWSAVGLSEADVDSGDYLLDWRYALPGQAEQVGLRYVHLYERNELASLAARSGFVIVDEFESDGKEGNLALYQVWK
ncbi:MAG: class I SAM-dependent methyltransferase, partial [Anaerolineaceae bacterium]|nr:class I SAM-dependent methyltransferase [Anaerolineaceae bacterium]